MILDFSSLVAIARMAILTMPSANVINAMATIQSSLSQSSPSAIEIADKAQRRVVVVSIVFGVVAALIAALLAWLVWRTSNKYQDAVKADADARIATADSRSAEANAEAAKANEGLAKSNEEIARLTKEAEEAKTERAEADKQIEKAKADAARAKEGIANAEAASAKASVEVARLQVVVANAEQKRAEAEKALLELQERLKPRRLTPTQKQRLVEILASRPKGAIAVHCESGNEEAYNFASDFVEALTLAGWTVEFVPRLVFVGKPQLGLVLKVQSDKTPRAYALQKAIEAIGLSAPSEAVATRPKDEVTLLIGHKP